MKSQKCNFFDLSTVLEARSKDILIYLVFPDSMREAATNLYQKLKGLL